ncbi:MAG: hypothetical protein ACFFC7_14370 [Candidatus Hermodarchaeota archaeon]
MLADVSAANADICFGAPTHNEWRFFTLNEPMNGKEYPTGFPAIETRSFSEKESS